MCQTLKVLKVNDLKENRMFNFITENQVES